MKIVKYLIKDNLTCENLEKILGVKILSITIGNIAVGEPQEALGEYGDSTMTVPVAEGIEIEFGDGCTVEQLDKLDLVLAGYRRESGKTIADRFDEMELRISSIEANYHE